MDQHDTQIAGVPVTDTSANVTSANFLLQTRWLVVAVFIASSLVTLVFWRILPSSFRANEQSDYYAFYEPVARNILAGRGLSRGSENPATAYPPGYPLILAAVFKASHWLNVSEETSLSALAVFGMALVSVFVFLLARMMWGPLPALIASSVWMTYPFALWLTKQPNSEIPFMVVLYGGLCLFWYVLGRKSRAWPLYFICGLLFGFAMLIRPLALGVGFVLALSVWFARREMTLRFRSLLVCVLLLGNLAAILPWESWVYSRTARVILLSNNGIGSMRDGLTFAVTSKGYREENHVSADVGVVMKDILARADHIATFRDLVSAMFQEFRAHPWAVTKLYLLKAVRSWYGTDSGRNEGSILFIQIVYLIPILWSVRRVWRQGGIYRGFAISVLFMVIYFWGMTFLVLSILRYMVPVMGLLFVLIGGAIFQPVRTGRKLAAN